MATSRRLGSSSCDRVDLNAPAEQADAAMTHETAEQRVIQQVRAALPPDYRVYSNVHWISRSRIGGPARDGETDLVIAHPERGLLIVEVKGGAIRRDGQGRWYSGIHELAPAPFEQARTSKYAILGKLREDPEWPASDPRAGHAVSFPDVDLATLPAGARVLGPEAPLELILDGTCLETPTATATSIERAYDYWIGDGAGSGVPLGERGMRVLDRLFEPEVELRPLLRRQIDRESQELVTLTRAQYDVLDHLRGVRRASVVGAAGTGKTMLAARRRGSSRREGFETLLVCFNRRSRGCSRRDARAAARDRPPRGPDVPPAVPRTSGARPATLPPKPDPVNAEWFDETLPDGARRGDRDARAALPRDRRRRGPGLRRRLAGVARGAAVRAEGGRALRLPRPGAGDLPRRRHREARARPNSPSTTTAATPSRSTTWRCRSPGAPETIAAPRDGPGARADRGRGRARRRSRRCARRSTGWSHEERVRPARSPC